MPKLTFKWQRFEELSAQSLYGLLRFRQQIFVVEQASPYPDLDGLDHAASHLLLRAAGEPAGYLRVATVPSLRIGRIAVAPALRGQGFGRRLMQHALAFCQEHHPGEPIVLTAQLYLVRFYRGLGFAPTSEPFDDFGLTHVDMRREPA